MALWHATMELPSLYCCRHERYVPMLVLHITELLYCVGRFVYASYFACERVEPFSRNTVRSMRTVGW